MSLILSAASIGEKNKLASSSAVLVLLEIDYDPEPIRVVANNENIVWPASGGDTYVAFNFDFDNLDEAKQKQATEVTLKVSNVSKVMQSYIEPDDGSIGREVIVRVVHEDLLAETTPWVELTFTVKKTDFDNLWVYFHLGTENLFTRRWPRDTAKKDFCRFKYQGADGRCGSTSGLTTCDKTLAACRVRNNSERFGGFAGLGRKGFFA